jgi:hypothetical protein
VTDLVLRGQLDANPDDLRLYDGTASSGPTVVSADGYSVGAATSAAAAAALAAAAANALGAATGAGAGQVVRAADGAVTAQTVASASGAAVRAADGYSDAQATENAEAVAIAAAQGETEAGARLNALALALLSAAGDAKSASSASAVDGSIAVVAGDGFTASSSVASAEDGSFGVVVVAADGYAIGGASSQVEFEAIEVEPKLAQQGGFVARATMPIKRGAQLLSWTGHAGSRSTAWAEGVAIQAASGESWSGGASLQVSGALALDPAYVAWRARLQRDDEELMLEL